MTTTTTPRSAMMPSSERVIRASGGGRQQQHSQSHGAGGDELIVGWPQSSSSLDESSSLVAAAAANATNERRRSSLSVSFAPHTKVIWHHTVDDMTDDEIDAAWYTAAEYKKIKKEAKTTLQYSILLSQRLASDPPTVTPRQVALGKKMCLRGLEHKRDVETLRARKESKDGVVRAVLVAQEENERLGGATGSHSSDQQQIRGFESHHRGEEAIALASIRASREARALAKEVGARDQEFVSDLRKRRERRQWTRHTGGLSEHARPPIEPFGPEPVDGDAGKYEAAKTLRPTGGFRSAYQQAIRAGFFRNTNTAQACDGGGNDSGTTTHV